MRVLAVSHSYPRHAGDLAGAFLDRLYRELAARGHAVRVLVPADEGRAEIRDDEGVIVQPVRYGPPRRETLAYRGTMTAAVRTPGGALAFRSLVRAVADAIRRHAGEADVVHANWWVPGGMSAARACRDADLPYVLTMHGTDAMLLRRSRVARWMAGPVVRRAARITVVSNHLADLVERTVGVRRPLVLPMPADVSPPPPSAGGGGLVTVGRLSAQKRMHLAIGALAALRGAGHDLTLTVIGDGPERHALGRTARSLEVGGSVRFVGALPPAEILPRIADADVFVFPARGEGFGLAAAEALIAGVPVVLAPDGGGVLDLSGDGVAVAAAADAGAIAGAVEATLRDPGAREAARRAGARWRAALDTRHVAARLETVLAEAARRTP